MDWLKLIIAVVICQAAGGLGSFFTVSSLGPWYAGLRKPAFNPPDGVFGPVWTLLYLLMGIVLYLVWRQGTTQPAVRTALLWFGVQLALNVLWSMLFFGLRSPWLGLIDILALWAAIAMTMVMCARVVPAAGWLLAPYLAWVSFAAVLNFFIWRLNLPS